MKIGYTSGAMDLLHAGHLIHLEICRNQCDMLIVGLHVNPNNENPKKHKPIESVDERLIRLKACKYVDMVIPYHTEAEQTKILEQLKPDIRFHGDDHKGDKYDGNYQTIFTKRDHEYSSTNLRRRIADAEK